MLFLFATGWDHFIIQKHHLGMAIMASHATSYSLISCISEL